MSLNLTFSKDIKPQDDFYSFVNSKWIKNNPIPQDFQRWSVFNELNEANRKKVYDLLKELSYSENNEFNSLKVLFDQGQNLKEINKTSSLDYVKNYINKISKVNDKEELLQVIFDIHVRHGLNTPFQFSVYSDLKDSSINILHIFTNGLTLPDRDYYFDDDKNNIRKEYKNFIDNYLKLFDLNFDIEKIFKIEEELAKVTLTKVQKRDPNNLYNPSSITEIESKYKSIPINLLFNYFKTINKLKNIKPGTINISNPKYLEKYDQLWNELDLNSWKNYYIWRFLLSVSSFINEEATNVKFDFFGKIISGTPELLPWWKRLINICDSQLGEVVAKMFVKKHFSEKSKEKALKLVSYIKDELKNRLENNDWMESKTKKKALEKLKLMRTKIGYPEVTKDYTKLVLSLKDNFLTNNLKCMKFNEDKDWEKLYKKKEKDEWFMHAHMVNAYYSPSNNEIVFPAGILQEPFFNYDYDAALNFGGIGCVIGHEITHGFDDQGRKFDSYGNLNDWWSENDAKKYKEKTDKIKNQYFNYVIQGKNLNGDLTLGENIADLGGVSISYYSFSNYLNDFPEENKVLDGLTPYKRFFINYAKIWRCNTRPKEILKRLVIDPHSPPEFRVNGVLTNLKEFYNAFEVKEGDKLWKPESERASIW